MGPEHDGSLSGEIRQPLTALTTLPLDARKVIAHRCMLAISAPHAVVNLGVGMPEARRPPQQNPLLSAAVMTSDMLA